MRKSGKALLEKNFPTIFFLILMILFLFLSMGFPFWGINFSTVDLTATIDFAAVNGILTATSLVFGIVIFVIKELGDNILEMFLMSLMPIIYLLYGIKLYIKDVIAVQKPTVMTLGILTSCLFFMILYIAALILFKYAEKRAEIRRFH